ncbi:MAG: polymorphic toxin type 44 domain-containing protein [Marivita sp.]|uniref:polymorphic toxin type 44 domain-containing protein n=1 Tax=Marivita sp. TaxID=2003365 RepID=UPI003EF4224D
MSQKWLAIRFRPHGSHPVSHSDRITIKVYFDENPGDTSDQTGNDEGNQYTVPSEHSFVMASAQAITIWCAITDAEFDASSYELFVWAEPYAIAAFSASGVSDNLALGRLKLGRTHEDYRGVAPGPVPPTASVTEGDDEVIVHEVFLANSVVQFIVDEINTNSVASDVEENADDIQRVRDAISEERENPSPPPLLPWSDTVLEDLQEQLDEEIDEARTRLGYRTHKNEGFLGGAQDAYFAVQNWGSGGGEWDHKPIIRPVWGALNRLGNAHEVYFYDGWSNIHFGYIGRRFGLSLRMILDGAGQAQEVDNPGDGQEGDDPADAQAIRAGYNLAASTSTVTRQNIINILNQHPNWAGRR